MSEPNTEQSAPERIWIQPNESNLSGVGPIWFTRKTGVGDIEYTRVRADVAGGGAIAHGWQYAGVDPSEPRKVIVIFETSEAATAFIDGIEPGKFIDPTEGADIINRQAALRVCQRFINLFVDTRSPTKIAAQEIERQIRDLPATTSTPATVGDQTNYTRAIQTLRDLRDTNDPVEVQRQREAWAQLRADLSPSAPAAVVEAARRNADNEEVATCANCSESIIKEPTSDHWIHEYGWSRKCLSDKLVATPAHVVEPREDAEFKCHFCGWTFATNYARECHDCEPEERDESVQSAGARIAEAEHQSAPIGRDGFMCEAHPGLDFEHDPDCAGPGMPWVIEGKDAIDAAILSAVQAERERCADTATYSGCSTCGEVIAAAIRKEKG